MYSKGHTKLKIDIKKIKKLPFIRVKSLDEYNTQDVKNYPKELITGFMCSDKTANDLKIEWAWTDCFRIKKYKISALAFYKLPPGYIVPWHKDHFVNFSKFYQVPREKVFRRIMFLEKWHPGQIFCIGEETITNWVPGDWIQWTHDCYHMGANHSNIPRHTLQITGVE